MCLSFVHRHALTAHLHQLVSCGKYHTSLGQPRCYKTVMSNGATPAAVQLPLSLKSLPMASGTMVHLPTLTAYVHLVSAYAMVGPRHVATEVYSIQPGCDIISQFCLVRLCIDFWH